MLSKTLLQLKSFQRQYESLLTLSASEQLANLTWKTSKDELKQQIDWCNLLSIASVLSYSDEPECLQAALRIVLTCLSVNEDEQLSNACGLILEGLSNQQALALAQDKHLLSRQYENSMGLCANIQRLKFSLQNQIEINDEPLSVNRFQKAVYEKSLLKRRLSICAPTSSGKSYILNRLILSHLKKNKGGNLIVYIVPTRALIEQVQRDLKDMLLNEKLDQQQVNIYTVPPREKVNLNQVNIFIFTQERLHWFLVGDFAAPIQMLVVDEAQKIEDGHRGVLLQETIEHAVRLSPKISLIFSAPFTRNPDIFFEGLDFSKNDYAIVDTHYVPVIQNLIYLEQVKRNPKTIQASLVTDKENLSLGTLNLSLRPKNGKNLLIEVVKKISQEDDCSIIYANGPSEAERLAESLANSLPTIDNEATRQAVELIKKVIHPTYKLSQIINHGVAFHYGNLPNLVRTEIENLFSKGIIKFLVCTSTLVEGVNTPAKNIFLLKPKKGRKQNLTSSDFWNLVGRAGRAGKEFAGNIFCINPGEWDSLPPRKQELRVLTKSLNEYCNSEKFHQELKDPSLTTSAETDYVLNYFYQRYLQNQQLTDIKNTEIKNLLISNFNQFRKTVHIPSKILVKNLNYSPIKQQKLLTKLQAINDLQPYIPVHPSKCDAFNVYLRILALISDALEIKLTDKQRKRLVTLALHWMKGTPLKNIIDKQIKKNKSLPQDAIIRGTMKTIEHDIRFDFLGYMNCYTVLLNHLVTEIQSRTDVTVPDVALWVELGVSTPSLIALIELGLSRSTSLEIEQFLSSKNLTTEDCVKELKVLDLNKLGLPRAMRQELEECIKFIR